MNYIWFIPVLIIVLVIVCVLRYHYTTTANRDASNMKTLVRQSARWSNASLQDSSPIVSLLHANYGAGYLWALQDLYTANEIEASTGTNFNQLKDKIIKAQDSATRKVALACPQFNKYLDMELARLGGEGV